MIKRGTDTMDRKATLPRRADGLLEYTMDGELVLCHPAVERVHVLNTTAAALWFLCDGRRTVAEISTELAGLFSMDVSRVEADVQETLGSFQGAGLLSIAAGEE